MKSFFFCKKRKGNTRNVYTSNRIQCRENVINHATTEVNRGKKCQHTQNKHRERIKKRRKKSWEKKREKKTQLSMTYLLCIHLAQRSRSNEQLSVECWNVAASVHSKLISLPLFLFLTHRCDVFSSFALCHISTNKFEIPSLSFVLHLL